MDKGEVQWKKLLALWLGAAALVMAAVALLLCALAPALPVIAGEFPEGPTGTLEEFFSRVEEKDYAGADALLWGAASLGLEEAPADDISAVLWQAGQNVVRAELSDGYRSSGAYLTKEVNITGPDLSAAGGEITVRLQELLTEAVARARSNGEVYTADGSFRDDVVNAKLRQAVDEVAQRLPTRTRTVKVRLQYVDGTWLVAADSALVAALTGGNAAGGKLSSGTELRTAYMDYVNNNVLASALDGLVSVSKVYRLPETTVKAPEPDQTAFGNSQNPEDTAPVLAEAESLLNGRELLWTTETELLPGKGVSWYRDDTILALSWRQMVGDIPLNFCEVVIADPSQFLRYMADDDFYSARRYRPSEMAETVNAVVALSGDYIKYRDLGISVYQRELCRAEGATLDTCFVDGRGDLLFAHRGELRDEESIRRYVEDNDIRFSLSFGPILIENGQSVVPESYPIGEINTSYTRCVLCQLGDCHYLLVTAQIYKSVGTLTLRHVADTLLTLGIQKAYTLDGGQTATLILNDELMNYVDFGEERTMSDILFFATAIPDEEGAHG